jgi:hypothetical protein
MKKIVLFVMPLLLIGCSPFERVYSDVNTEVVVTDYVDTIQDTGNNDFNTSIITFRESIYTAIRLEYPIQIDRNKKYELLKRTVDGMDWYKLQISEDNMEVKSTVQK